MTNSGCATLGVGIGDHDENGAEPLDEHHRTNCLLFKGSLCRSVRDIMEKQWRKFKKRLRSSVRTSPGAQNTGWMDINTVMEIFRQMSVLQGQTQRIGSKESNTQHRIIHMDLRPDHFRVYKDKTSSEGSKYIVKLVGAGCAVDGSMRLDSIADRTRAACLISSTTTQRYHAPEIFLFTDELTDKYDELTDK
jgi:hypothetical protein